MLRDRPRQQTAAASFHRGKTASPGMPHRALQSFKSQYSMTPLPRTGSVSAQHHALAPEAPAAFSFDDPSSWTTSNIQEFMKTPAYYVSPEAKASHAGHRTAEQPNRTTRAASVPVMLSQPCGRVASPSPSDGPHDQSWTTHVFEPDIEDSLLHDQVYESDSQATLSTSATVADDSSSHSMHNADTPLPLTPTPSSPVSPASTTSKLKRARISDLAEDERLAKRANNRGYSKTRRDKAKGMAKELEETRKRNAELEVEIRVLKGQLEVYEVAMGVKAGKT